MPSAAASQVKPAARARPAAAAAPLSPSAAAIAAAAPRRVVGVEVRGQAAGDLAQHREVASRRPARRARIASSTGRPKPSARVGNAATPAIRHSASSSASGT